MSNDLFRDIVFGLGLWLSLRIKLMILGPAGFGLGAQVLVNIPGFMPVTGI